MKCAVCQARRPVTIDGEPPADCDWYCSACGEVDQPGGVFVPRYESQEAEVAAPAAAAPPPPANPTYQRPNRAPSRTDSPARLPTSPAPRLSTGESALDAILSTLAQGAGAGSSATVLRQALFTGHLVRHDAAPADGVVWRGCLALDDMGTASEEAQRALKAAWQHLPAGTLPVAARGPAAGAPGAGPEGTARAAAVGRLLPHSSAPVLCSWVSSSSDDVPQPGECLAALRITAPDGHEAALQAVLSVLDHHGGCLVAEVAHGNDMLLWLLPPTALPTPFRPRTGGLSCLYALAVETPLPPLMGVPPPGAYPARSILPPYQPCSYVPAPFVGDDHDGPLAETHVPAQPSACPPLAGLRFVLLGYPDTEPAVADALAHGAVLVPVSEAAPDSVDLLVFHPTRVLLLNDGPLTLSTFLLHRHITCVQGLDYLAACVASHTRLPPWQVPGQELFPAGILVLSDADTLSSGPDVTRTALGLLTRCAAASNAATAAVYGGGTHRLCWWRLMLSPSEHSALNHIAKSATSPFGSEAWLAFEEARAVPGPGVGSAGVPRSGVLSPGDVSRSTVPDPPQALRDAMKVAALRAADCRLVLLMTNRPELQAALRGQRTVAGGSPAECFALMQGMLDQARREQQGAAAGAAGGRHRVSFSAEVDALPQVQCAKLGKARKRERGEFVVEQPPGKEARVSAPGEAHE